MKYGHGKGRLDPARPESFAATLAEYEDTRALANEVVRVPFRRSDGTVELGLETKSLIRVLAQLVVVGQRSRHPRVRDFGRLAKEWLPALRAFDAGESDAEARDDSDQE
jgi:hypothetical protein